MNPPYTFIALDIRVESVILVFHSTHFFSGVLGPISVTILDKEISHIPFSLYNLNAACISPTRYTGSNSHIISDCHYINPAHQYTVTLTRRGQQPDCQSYVDNVNVTTSSESVVLVVLEENSFYSVSVIAITFDLTRTVIAADITTLTAGEYIRSYFFHGCYLIIILYYIQL